MTTLPYTTINVVDCHDLDRIITQAFNRPYNTGRAEDSPANDTLHRVYPEFLLESPEEMEYAQEKFDQWMAMPAADTISQHSEQWYAAEDASPPAALMIIKLREKGIQMPENFSIKIWW